jgi:hypothetical protein
MSSKEKFLANGDLDKVKARAAVGGDRVEAGAVGVISSSSLTMILNVADFTRSEVFTHEVTEAFLAADLTVDERPTYLKLDEVMVGFVPDAKPFIEKGTDRVCFHVLLYSCAPPQASSHSPRHMGGTLKMLGFERLLSDKSVYVRGQCAKVGVIEAIHADEMLVTGFLFLRAKLQKETKEEYALADHSRPYLSHVGPATDARSTSASMFRKGCLPCMHRKFEHVTKSYKGSARTPYLPSLTLLPSITTDPEPKDCKLEAKEKKMTDAADVTSSETNITALLSIVMSLTWPTWTTGKDTPSFITCPATGTHASTVACPRVVVRALSCLQNMSNQTAKLEGGYETKCVLAKVYHDACHDTHLDGERHGRIKIAMCSRDIHVRSINVKTTTPSSTEDQTHYDQARLSRAQTHQMAPRYPRTSCQSVLQRSYCSDARRPQERWNWIRTRRSNYRYVDS